MMNIEREHFLTQLELLRPGLSPKEIIEQSSCFVFIDGLIRTYNDEVSCSIKSPLDIQGAVQAQPLLNTISKIPTSHISIELGDGEFLIKDKKRNAGIRMEAQVLLPFQSVELPEKWKKINPQEFSDAVSLVTKCASKDESRFDLTCVHVTSEYIEAADTTQMCRHKIDLPVKQEFIVRAVSLNHIIGLGMSRISETPNWIHFKNPAGLVMSCRRQTDEYPKLSKFLKVEGELSTFPKGVSVAAEAASVFSSENADNDKITVVVSPNKDGKKGRLKVLGEGASGWYSEVKNIEYHGKPLKFRMSPDMLIGLLKQHQDCYINDTRLMIDTGNYVYATALGAADEKDE